MKHLILIGLCLVTSLTFASGVSYDTDTTTEKAVFDDGNQILNVTIEARLEDVTAPSFALCSENAFAFEDVNHEDGLKISKHSEDVSAMYRRKARDSLTC